MSENTNLENNELLTENDFSDELKKQTIKDYYTPEMFGAVGDGVYDDTACVQSCIDAAITDATTVKLVGTYYISSPVYIEGSVSIEGIGTARNEKTAKGCVLFDGVNFPIDDLGNKGAFVIAKTTSGVDARGISIKNVSFEQIPIVHDDNSETYEGHCSGIYIGGSANVLNYSCLSVVDCSFNKCTGYAIKFYGHLYIQMIEMRNLSCWYCGGVIGADTDDANVGLSTNGVFVTCATLNNINLDGCVNQITPCNPILDLSGFREYMLTNVVLEGSYGNSGTAVRISNSKWQFVDGIHVEFTDENTAPTTMLEVCQSNYNQGASSAHVVLNGVTTPLLLSANYTTLTLNGIYKYRTEQQIFVTGIGSTVNVNNMVVKGADYNIFNHNDIGKINYRDVRIAEIASPLPLSLKSNIKLFEWDATQGTLRGFSNQYFTANTGSTLVESQELYQTEDIGYVYRLVPNAENTEFVGVGLRINDSAKAFLAGKTITMAITYRLKCNEDDVNSDSIKKRIKVAYSSGAVQSVTSLNGNIANDLAIAICTMIPTETTVGFSYYYFRDAKEGWEQVENPITTDIVGIKVYLGSEAEGTAPVWSA